MRYSDIKKCCNSTRPKAPAMKSSLAFGLVTALLRLNRSLSGKSDRGILYLKRRESLNSLFSTKP